MLLPLSVCGRKMSLFRFFPEKAILQQSDGSIERLQKSFDGRASTLSMLWPRSAPSCAGFCISGDGGGIQWAEVMNMHLLSLAPLETRSDTPRLVLTGREELLIEQHAGLFPMKPGASG